MDPSLPLPDLPSLLPTDGPFTRAGARAAGVSRTSLEAMLRAGSVRRLLRGVYTASSAPDSPEHRAAAVALVAGREAVVVDRTAAWIHGAPVPGTGPVQPLETLSVRRPARGSFGASRRLAGHDVAHLGALRLTTPLRTALDLGRLLPPEQALAVMDGLLSTSGLGLSSLLAELPRMVGHRGVGQLRSLAAQVDVRARGPAESVLRLHWNAADLPSAVPGLMVAAGPRLVRLALGVERCRFGALVAGRATTEDLLALREVGWTAVVLSEQRVLTGDPELWIRHLTREFHQHLLAEHA